MPVVRKFFPLDKNYILEQAQLSVADSLLEYLVDYVKVQYMLQHNPLGLVDETVNRIQQHEIHDFSRLQDFYITLAGIFRFRHYHDNQLEFIFSGEEPYDRYCREWTSFKMGEAVPNTKISSWVCWSLRCLSA